MLELAMAASGSVALAVEFRVVPENALVVEGNAPIRREISRNAWTLLHALCERDQPGNLPLEPFHAIGERVAQAGDQLEQRQVDVAQPPAEHMVSAVFLQHALEIA